MNERQRTVAQVYEHAHERHKHDGRNKRTLARPASTIGNNRRAGLNERERARKSREQNEHEEHGTDDSRCAAKVFEHLRQNDEHERRARVLSHSIARTKRGKRGGDDHETREQRNAKRGTRNLRNRRGKLRGLLQIGAIRHHNAHGERQGEERLTKRGDNQFRRELAEVGNQVVGKAIHGARQGERVNRNGNSHHDKGGHHDEVRLLDALIHAKRDDEIRQSHENEHENDAFGTRANKGREIVAAIGKHLGGGHDIAEQVFRDPTTNYAVIRHDDERNRRHENADERILLAECLERANAALPRLAAKRRLKQQQRKANSEHKNEVHEQKHAAAVFRGQIGETPHAAQANRRSGRRQHEGKFA